MLHRIYHNEISKNDIDKIIFDKKVKHRLCDYPAQYITDLFSFTSSDASELRDFIENGVYTPTSLALCGGDIAKLGIFPKNMTAKVHKAVLYSVAGGDTQNTEESIIEFLNNLKI